MVTVLLKNGQQKADCAGFFGTTMKNRQDDGMKLIAEIDITVRRGYLPHLTNEIYKRGCALVRLSQTGFTDQGDSFLIQISFDTRVKFTGFLEKIEKHHDNFSINNIRNIIEDAIQGGMLVVAGKVGIETDDDYSMKVLGARELMYEKIEGNDISGYIGTANNICLLNGIKTSSEGMNYLKAYVSSECDSMLINRFSGLNAYPIVFKYAQIEDLIKYIRALEDGFSVIRLCSIDEDGEYSSHEQIYKEISRPLLNREYDEMPLYVIMLILTLLRRNNLAVSEINAGFMGINIGVVRSTHFLKKAGCQRIIGYDADDSLLIDFENEGGLATNIDNVLNNSDIVISSKNLLTADDFEKIRSGQIIISFDERSGFDGTAVREKGIRDFQQARVSDLGIFLPGIVQGLQKSGKARLEDEDILGLADLLSTRGADTPSLFGTIHTIIRDYLAK